MSVYNSVRHAHSHTVQQHTAAIRRNHTARCNAHRSHHEQSDAAPPRRLALLLAPAAVAVTAAAAAGAAVASEALGAPVAAVSAVDLSTFKPSPQDPGWEVWFGAVAGVIPFAVGGWEFFKRILIQRRCQVCAGRGLVQKGKLLKKCPQCGGFFPWVSWKMFLTSTAAPGNGGPLLQPKGQTSVFYTVPPPLPSGQGSAGWSGTVAEPQRSETTSGEGGSTGSGAAADAATASAAPAVSSVGSDAGQTPP